MWFVYSDSTVLENVTFFQAIETAFPDCALNVGPYFIRKYIVWPIFLEQLRKIPLEILEYIGMNFLIL